MENVSSSQINSTNFTKLDNPEKLSKINSDQHWHKFILKNGGALDSETVLYAIVNAADPIDVVPVQYTVEGDDSSFLARKCPRFILKLCQDLRLVIPVPGEDNTQVVFLEVVIQLCYLLTDDFYISMQDLLKIAIGKASSDDAVDLSYFHRQPALSVFFCPLSEPQFLNYVLHIIVGVVLKFSKIDLSCNKLKCLEQLKVLANTGVTHLNLKDNLLSDVSALEVLKNVHGLQELHLSGNPLCKTFDDSRKYLQAVLAIVPTLTHLDGVPIQCGVPVFRNYLCDTEASNTVEQILTYYFAVYDTDRPSLKNCYHNDACLSITYSPEQANLSGLAVDLKMTDVKHLKIGQANIVAFLCSQANTSHCMDTFYVDMTVNEDMFSMLFMSGYVVECDKVFHFRRTFIVDNSCQFKIVNDILYMEAAPQTYMKILKPYVTASVEMLEKHRAVSCVQRLTNMNQPYAVKCLEDNNGDLRAALRSFLFLYEQKKLPVQVFDNNTKGFHDATECTWK